MARRRQQRECTLKQFLDIINHEDAENLVVRPAEGKGMLLEYKQNVCSSLLVVCLSSGNYCTYDHDDGRHRPFPLGLHMYAPEHLSVHKNWIQDSVTNNHVAYICGFQVVT